MTPKDVLDRLNRQFATTIAPAIDALGTDVRQQVSAAARSTFERMDIVSREEFEAQRAVLLRSREKLEALEKKVAELETRLTERDQH